MANIRGDMQNLYQLMVVTRINVANLSVKGSRPKKKYQRARSAHCPGPADGINWRQNFRLPRQHRKRSVRRRRFRQDKLATCWSLMQEALEMLQSELRPAQIGRHPGSMQAQPLLEQLQGMMEQMQSLVFTPSKCRNQTPRLPPPTLNTDRHRSTSCIDIPNPISESTQFSQLQAMLDEMETILRQMKTYCRACRIRFPSAALVREGAANSYHWFLSRQQIWSAAKDLCFRIKSIDYKLIGHFIDHRTGRIALFAKKTC